MDARDQVSPQVQAPPLGGNRQRSAWLPVQRAVKAAVDWVGASLLAVFTAPLVVAAIIAVWLEDGGPFFFRRRVIGQHGLFDAFKIRTMRPDADQILSADPELETEFKKNFKLANDPRTTRCGRVLRKYNLDELPQFWNVLRGEMSLIGPRIKTPEEFTRYGDAKAEVLSMKPGITGYWQVTARHRVSYEERVRLDLHYIRNWSFWFDLRILFSTIRIVIRGQGD